MTDELTYMRNKWRCSQCGMLNSMDDDNICPWCLRLALDLDQKKLDDAVSRPPGSGE